MKTQERSTAEARFSSTPFGFGHYPSVQQRSCCNKASTQHYALSDLFHDFPPNQLQTPFPPQIHLLINIHILLRIFREIFHKIPACTQPTGHRSTAHTRTMSTKHPDSVQSYRLCCFSLVCLMLFTRLCATLQVFSLHFKLSTSYHLPMSASLNI